MALARLREQFGDPLWVRAGRGHEADAARRAPRRAGAAIVALADGSLRGERGFDPATAKDEFVFALSDVGELVFLPRLVEALAQAAPGAGVRSVTLSPVDTERGLEDGSVDLAVGYFPDLKTQHFRQRLFTPLLRLPGARRPSALRPAVHAAAVPRLQPCGGAFGQPLAGAVRALPGAREASLAASRCRRRISPACRS